MKFGANNIISAGILIGLFWGLPGFDRVLAEQSEPRPEPIADPMIEELERVGLLHPFGVFLTDSTATNGAVEEFIGRAIRHNPALRSRFADYLALSETVNQVSGLPDPRFGYTEYLKPVETRVGPQKRSFSLSQSFPWFGSLSMKGEIIKENAAATRGIFYNSALEIMAEVKQAFFDLGYLDQAVRITKQHVGLMTQLEDVSRARYSAGSGQYADVIKAQVELGVLLDRLAGLEDQRRPLVAVLNGLLNFPSTQPVHVGIMPDMAESPLGLQDLSQGMVERNPMIEAWDHRAQSSLNAEKLAGKQGLPSFSLGVNYILTGEAAMDGVVDSGTDALMASLAVTIPIWRGKYDAASKVAISQYQGALSSKRDLINNLSTTLEQAHYRYRDALRKFELYGTALLPKGRQSLGASRTAYEAGNGSFLDLVDAQRLVLEFELTMVQAKFDVLNQEAILEKLTAGPITHSQGSESESQARNKQIKD